jgi:hypothetical protein
MTLVGDFADDLDNDVGLGALGVDVGDADFGVLEVEELDALVDGLLLSDTTTSTWSIAFVPFVLHRR